MAADAAAAERVRSKAQAGIVVMEEEAAAEAEEEAEKEEAEEAEAEETEEEEDVEDAPEETMEVGGGGSTPKAEASETAGIANMPTGMETVGAMLSHCRLEQYAATFEAEGYDDLLFLASLDEARLRSIATSELGMKPGHVAKLIYMLPGYLADHAP